MYKNFLVPVALDKERDVGSAMKIARQLLDEGGKITALHVVEMIPEYVAAQMPDNFQDKRQSEAMASLKAELGGVGDVKVVVVVGHSGQAIQGYAEQHDCDCIVVASHRLGFTDIFLGSTAAWVVRHAKCSVHVNR